MKASTKSIIAWMDRMIEKYGFCGIVSEVLAEYMGESGNDDPSGAAVLKALEWEKDPSEMLEYMQNREDRWCMSPSVGCLKFCRPRVYADFPKVILDRIKPPESHDNAAHVVVQKNSER